MWWTDCKGVGPQAGWVRIEVESERKRTFLCNLAVRGGDGLPSSWPDSSIKECV